MHLGGGFTSIIWKKEYEFNSFMWALIVLSSITKIGKQSVQSNLIMDFGDNDHTIRGLIWFFECHGRLNEKELNIHCGGTSNFLRIVNFILYFEFEYRKDILSMGIQFTNLNAKSHAQTPPQVLKKDQKHYLEIFTQLDILCLQLPFSEQNYRIMSGTTALENYHS